MKLRTFGTAAALWLILTTISHAATYKIDTSINTSSGPVVGSGSFDVADDALVPNSDILFSSGSIANFVFEIDGLTFLGSNNLNPAGDGVTTDATGTVVSFGTDHSSDFVRFSIAANGFGAFFHKSTFEFRFRGPTTGGGLVTGGTYSISEVSAVPLPAGGLLLFSGLGGIVALARRRKHAASIDNA